MIDSFITPTMEIGKKIAPNHRKKVEAENYHTNYHIYHYFPIEIYKNHIKPNPKERRQVADSQLKKEYLYYM